MYCFITEVGGEGGWGGGGNQLPTEKYNFLYFFVGCFSIIQTFDNSIRLPSKYFSLTAHKSNYISLESSRFRVYVCVHVYA